MWGGAAFILAATTFFLRPNGLAGVPEILSAWLAAWANSATGSAQISISVGQLVQILLTYDLLILCFGIAGLIFALRRTTGVSVLLSVWAIGALLIVLLQPGRQVLDLVLVLTPLTLLGGSLLDRVATELQQYWLMASGRIVRARRSDHVRFCGNSRRQCGGGPDVGH